MLIASGEELPEVRNLFAAAAQREGNAEVRRLLAVSGRSASGDNGFPGCPGTKCQETTASRSVREGNVRRQWLPGVSGNQMPGDNGLPECLGR
jgi:hypothetical protein